MKGVILAIQEDVSFVLRADGEFVKLPAHDFHQIGAEIDVRLANTNPVGLERRFSERRANWHQDADGGLDRRQKLRRTVDRDVIRRRRTRLRWMKRLAVTAAMFAIFVGGGMFANYWDSVAYSVYVDINPSVRFEVNKADVIISEAPLNNDGENLLSQINAGGKISEAMSSLVSVAKSETDLAEHGIILTIVSGDKPDIDTLVGALQRVAPGTDVAIVYATPEEELKAYNDGITPLKYKRALAAMAVNEGLSYEDAIQLSSDQLAHMASM